MPIPIQFPRSFRTVFYQTCLSRSNGNCATDFDSILATVGTYCQNFVVDTAEIPEEKKSAQSLNIVEADYQQLLVGKNLINKNAITYVTGYLAKKYFQNINVETNCRINETCNKAPWQIMFSMAQENCSHILSLLGDGQTIWQT